jgi:hypothetical protein
MKVGMILPVYRDDRHYWYKNFVKKMIPSLFYLRNTPIKFLINFQRFGQSQVDQLIANMALSYGSSFQYGHIINYYEPPVSMSKIREDTAQIDPTCDIYICADDDMVFGRNASRRYNEIIKYMEETPKCGVVMALGYYGGNHTKEKIIDTYEMIWQTARGLFLRNVGDPGWVFVPPDSWECVGGLEDAYAVYSRFALGYTGAKTFCLDIISHGGKSDHRFEVANRKRGRYPIDTDIHNPKFDCITKLIRQKWEDPDWLLWRKRLPKGLASLQIPPQDC